jgi:hypothetical protein
MTANWRSRQIGIPLAKVCGGVISGKEGDVKNTRKKAGGKQPISRSLRDAIRERGLTAYAAAKQAGVSADAVQRFLNSERGLTLATADRLAEALQLTLCPEAG